MRLYRDGEGPGKGTGGRKLRKSAEEVAKRKMPPWYYALVHPEARLADGEREMLRAWTAGEIGRLAP